MDRNVRASAKRVLAVGTPSVFERASLDELLEPDGILIVMEADPVRVELTRQRFLASGLGARATVIAGDPRRMLYKLAGPFDVIFCADEYHTIRDRLEPLLAPEGVLLCQ